MFAEAKAGVASQARAASREEGRAAELEALTQLQELERGGSMLLQQARDLGVRLDDPEDRIAKLAARVRMAREKSGADAAALEGALREAESAQRIKRMGKNSVEANNMA